MHLVDYYICSLCLSLFINNILVIHMLKITTFKFIINSICCSDLQGLILSNFIHNSKPTKFDP